MSDNESGQSSHTRSVVFETLADFWCEAAVLVAVFLSLGAMLKILAR